MSSSIHANKGINSTMYSINFTENNKKSVLSLHYNENNSYFLVNGTEIHKFKAKDSEIVATSLCLGNILKDFSVDNMKKWICLNGYVYEFNIDYSAIANDKILGIHKYLIEKNGVIKMWRFVKKTFAVITIFFNLSYVNSLECILVNNQECKARSKIIDVNSNELVFYPYSIKVK